jgi:glycosyltransferase involved in cell wall biosynthesis
MPLAFEGFTVLMPSRGRTIGGDSRPEIAFALEHERISMSDQALDDPDQNRPPSGFCGLDVAVLLPCYNEELAVTSVVEAFLKVLPQARIYVYDNNSSDASATVARRAGAIVRDEPRRGKGHVVRRMFADVDADIYVMCDADDTYDPAGVTGMIDRLVREGLDMVVASRHAETGTAYRPGHRFGNWMLSAMVRQIFGGGLEDMLSGFRVFSNRFVKSFPAMSSGFEIETELTIHALELEMPVAEVPTAFTDRAEGSESKLHTFSDGIRIFATILTLLKQERPLHIFGGIGFFMMILSLGIGYPLFVTFMETGLVPRQPTAVLATGIMILAFFSIFCGLILDTVTRGRKEAKRIRYLGVPGIFAVLEKKAGAGQQVMADR